MRLKGRSALVTGASRGLGRAMALEFAAQGANVAINYIAVEERNRADAEKVASECAACNVKALPVEADVTDFDACQRMGARVLAEFGQIDILVNNAGILRDKTLRKMTAEQWNSVINVNLTGAFNVTRGVIEAMLERNYGRIVSVSSISGLQGFHGQTNYSASKAGITGFTKALAREVAGKGITANAIAPGFFETEMLGEIKEDVMAHYRQVIPVGRLGKPSELAKLVAFLCSEDAGYITGQVIGINGGWYM